MSPILPSALALCLSLAVAQRSDEPQTRLDPTETREAALALLEEGRAGEAAELFAALARQDPTDAESRRLLGHARLAEGRAESARAAFVEAFALGRITPGMLVAMTRLDLEGGRRHAAEAGFERLLWFEPAELDASLLRAQNLAALGRPTAARALVDELVARFPTDPRVRRLEGSFVLERGDELAAARALELAFWLGSAEVALAEVLAGVALRRGHPERAAAWLDRAAAASAGADRRASAELWRSVARLELEAGRPAAAIELLEGPARNPGTLADVEELLGHALFAAGRPTEATQAWRRAALAGCDDRGVLSHLVAAGLEGDDPDLIADFVEPLVRVAEPRDTDATRLAFLAYERLGRTLDARAVVRRHVSHLGLDDAARELLATLAPDGPRVTLEGASDDDRDVQDG